MFSMIYEMMRMMAGPAANVADIYVAHQDVLNSVVVVGGIAWLAYDRKYRSHIKTEEKPSVFSRRARVKTSK